MPGPEAILRDLALCPAASFHEERVFAAITRFLDNQGLDYSVDGYGNIVARYQRGFAPPLATVAHMDHPAFELIDANTALLLGGVGLDSLRPGTAVRLFPDGAGRITGARRREDGSITFELETNVSTAEGDWGVWEMDDFREDGVYLRMRAADDLAGCTVALATLADLKAGGAEANLYALFTRAEEVGLVGATLVAQDRVLPEDTVVISLESSKVIPGVQQGLGPIIRVGDLRRTFDASAEALLHSGVEALHRDDPEFRVQRHLMSGGTCEATAFAGYGYAVTGIALPLGNYHNVSESGRLEPEYIHRADLAGAVALLQAAIKAAPNADRSPSRRRLDEMARKYRDRLRPLGKT